MLKYLSVVIPAYNEEENLKKGVLDQVYNFLKNQKYTWEVIFIDDQSTDQTDQLIEEFIKNKDNSRLIKNPHQGKAGTVTTGMLKAKGEIVLFTDMDQAVPLSEIEKLLPYFKEGFDVVIGSRSEERKGAPLVRKVMARGFMILRSLILSLKVEDTQCGFKAFTQSAAQDIFKRLKVDQQGSVQGATVTAAFDVEFLFIAQKRGYKIKEVPVTWNYQESKRVNPLKESWKGLKGLISIKLNDWQGVYGR